MTGQLKLGLLEDNTSKNTLQELGIKDGSNIIIVNNINYTLMGTQEKQLKLRQIFTEIGRLYDLDGETIFDLQYNFS